MYVEFSSKLELSIDHGFRIFWSMAKPPVALGGILFMSSIAQSVLKPFLPQGISAKYDFLTIAFQTRSRDAPIEGI